jgi:hypothetical protein
MTNRWLVLKKMRGLLEGVCKKRGDGGEMVEWDLMEQGVVNGFFSAIHLSMR